VVGHPRAPINFNAAAQVQGASLERFQLKWDRKAILYPVRLKTRKHCFKPGKNTIFSRINF
jgi:hypothetical protein